VGGRYSNRLGEYEVLSISGDQMTIRYDNGTKTTVNKSVQIRIAQNMTLDAMRVSPYPEKQEEQNQAYFQSIGFLSTRATMLEAIVPPHSLGGFIKDYARIKNVTPHEGQSGLYIHNPLADKWGCELRITFAATETETATLDFGPDVHIVVDPMSNNSWRINNNSFWWRLLRFGFEMGNMQDESRIKNSIPLRYRDFFDVGAKIK